MEQSNSDMILRPLPYADEVSAPFWDAAHQGALHIQRCTSCRHWIHAPVLACPACGSEALAFETASGRASIYSWTILHTAPAPGFRDRLPLVIGIVELEEQKGLFMTANIINTPTEKLRLGLPLHVVFERLTDEITLPQFTAAEA